MILRQQKHKGFYPAEIGKQLDTLPNDDVQNQPFEFQDTQVLLDHGQRPPSRVEDRPTLQGHFQGAPYLVENNPVRRELAAEPIPVPRQV
jgi:hypothetical protein